ncbi:hypothetical protein IU501_35325 [Nocardia otitidiscaviarum]|uniref:hypothetical protein n=1 Tax=Nocardia otitidiscaviarum TaxID=1823 RepID=UPI001893C645|nr:hypothetical protein [Nocardia otitidiscaviarum]MBF6138246.1 hypothetical protein [Nocardia otitidiscaviarum]
MTVLSKNRRSARHLPTSFDIRPAGPALDLSTNRVAALTAEVERLRAELHGMQLLVDNLLDRESMHVYDADMERLTTAASLERLGTPRARHLPAPAAVEATVTGPVSW